MENVSTAHGDVTVDARTPRLIRVRLFGPPSVPDASYVRRDDWSDVAAADSPSGLPPGRYVATPHAAVRIDAVDDRSVRLAFFDAAGRPLLATASNDGIVREGVVDAATGARRDRVVLQLTRHRSDVADDIVMLYLTNLTRRARIEGG